MVKDKAQRVKLILTRLHIVFKIITNKGFCSLPIQKRIQMNIKGFVGDHWVLYNFSQNNIDDYISEYELQLSRNINKQYSIIMNDKLLFSEIFKNHVKVPKIHFFILSGNLIGFDGIKNNLNAVINLLSKEDKLIIKPVNGRGGNNIHLLSQIDHQDKQLTEKEKENSFTLDGKPTSKSGLMSFLGNLNEFIITEFINQHQYANELFKDTVNSIRLITLRNPITGEITIPVSIQRVGRYDTIPVDNFDKGGLSVEINPESGTLGHAASLLNCSKTHPIFMSTHPDTGAQITGIKIPYWHTMKQEILEVAKNFPYLQFIAWDIVINEEGFTVLEINKTSGVKCFQVFGGMKNRSLGDFYRHHGIIK